MRALLPSVLVALVGCGGDTPSPADGGVDASSAECAEATDCDDGAFCNGVETCDPVDPGAGPTGCLPGEAPCTGRERCDEDADMCVPLCKIEDADGDGRIAIACGGDDCDDDDGLAFPGNVEVCDADDRDEDCDATTFGVRDGDGDGAPDDQCCNGTTCGTDCDDSRPDVQEGEVEACDGLDNDCDDNTDEGLLGTFYPDEDGDMYGDPDGTAVTGCRPPTGYTDNATDCNDDDPTNNPGLPEICDMRDNDCDTRIDEMAAPTTWYRDDDGDGFGSSSSGTTTSCEIPTGYSLYSTDCDDSSPSVHPGIRDDTCNGIDDDCNGWFDGPMEDSDGDRHARAACGGDDCDDVDPAAHPGAPEICDRRDTDCGSGGGAAPAEDMDNDGYAPVGITICAGGPRLPVDCDDSRATVSPGGVDVCNGLDDDCDSSTDEEPTASSTCALANATSACVSAACAILSCNTTYVNCDGLVTTGCEVNAATSLMHCGGCGMVCAPAHATPSCVAGTCQMSCNTGYADCGGGVGDGCETSTTTLMDCGSCGAACARDHAAETCPGGTCTLGACDPGWANCDSDPVSGCERSIVTTTDCNACGVSCSQPHATATCSTGMCAVASCDAGWGDCTPGGGASAGCETDTTSTRDHCGGCGMACIARGTGACVTGTCHPRIEWSLGVGTSNTQLANAVAVDASGNVYVAGQYRNSVDFGGGSVMNRGGSDAFLASYSPTGAFRWVRPFGSTFDDVAFDVQVSGTSVVVVGTFATGTDFGGGPVTAGGFDGFVASYASATGAYDWATPLPTVDEVRGVTIAASGDVHTIGIESGAIRLQRLSSAGTLLGTHSITDGVGLAIAVDAAGNRYFGGYFSSMLDFGGGITLPTVDGMADVFVASVTAAGVHRWSHAYGAPGGDRLTGLSLDASGNVAFAATIDSAANFGGGVIPSGTPANGSIAVVSLRASDGMHRWSRAFGDFSDDHGNSLITTSTGSVVVASESYNPVDLGGGTHAPGFGYSQVASYRADTGAFEWSYRLSASAGHVWSYDLATTSSGRVLLAGRFDMATDLGAGPIPFGGGVDDILIVSLAP